MNVNGLMRIVLLLVKVVVKICFDKVSLMSSSLIEGGGGTKHFDVMSTIFVEILPSSTKTDDFRWNNAADDRSLNLMADFNDSSCTQLATLDNSLNRLSCTCRVN